MTPDDYREANSYDGVTPMDVTVWDVLILVLNSLESFFGGLRFLARASYNHRVERKVVEMEMHAALESIR
jgi:hypothetical protein